MTEQNSGKSWRQHDSARPTGIAVLSFLFVFGGLLWVGFSIWVALSNSAQDGLAEVGSLLDASAISVYGGILLLAALTIGSGVGLLLSRKWGWGLATFYFIYSVFRNLNALVWLIALSDAMAAEPGTRSAAYYVFKHGFRVVIHLWIYSYLLKPHVMEYFGLQDLPRRKVVAIQVGICFGLMVLISAVSFI